MRPACSSCSCNGLGGPADYVPGSSRKGSSLGSYRAFSVPLRVYGSCQGSSSLGFQKVLKRFFLQKWVLFVPLWVLLQSSQGFYGFFKFKDATGEDRV